MAIESMRLGAMDYLSKPLDMAKIREVDWPAVAISKLIRGDVANGRIAGSGEVNFAEHISRTP